MVKPTPTTKPRSSWSWTQKGPGHEVKCRLKVYPAPTPMQSQWAGLPPVISVDRPGEREGKFFHTTTYYLTKETSQAYALAPTVRGHRKIEHHLPWVKEVIFKEDHCGISSPPPAATLGVFRNFAFNLLVFEGFHSLIEGIPNGPSFSCHQRSTVTTNHGTTWEEGSGQPTD